MDNGQQLVRDIVQGQPFILDACRSILRKLHKEIEEEMAKHRLGIRKEEGNGESK